MGPVVRASTCSVKLNDLSSFWVGFVVRLPCKTNTDVVPVHLGFRPRNDWIWQALGQRLLIRQASTLGQLQDAFATMKQQQVRALIVSSDPFFFPSIA